MGFNELGKCLCTESSPLCSRAPWDFCTLPRPRPCAQATPLRTGHAPLPRPWPAHTELAATASLAAVTTGVPASPRQPPADCGHVEKSAVRHLFLGTSQRGDSFPGKNSSPRRGSPLCDGPVFSYNKAKIPAKMLQLQGPQMLRMLEKSLRKSLPESLKVYGTIFHMNQGNPFKLKALVDRWPDFNTVVIRPQEQEMTDDLDHYTNTYQIYSKDPENCQDFLGSSEVINWKQHLQIQSSQSKLNEVIENIVAVNLGKVKQTQCILYMIDKTAKELVPSMLDATKSLPTDGSQGSLNQEMLKLASLDVAHAALVNKFWHFGGNERSLRFIERCIQTFPTFCALGPEGTPVSWSLMDQTGELRMAGTVPEYRGHGLIGRVICAQIQALEQLGFPMYSHVAKDNRTMQRVSASIRSVPMPCDWNQWRCAPL